MRQRDAKKSIHKYTQKAMKLKSVQEKKLSVIAFTCLSVSVCFCFSSYLRLFSVHFHMTFLSLLIKLFANCKWYKSGKK